MMQRCRECDEPIVRQSPVAGVCMCCYHVLDMGRHDEIEPPEWKGPFHCDLCMDRGTKLRRRGEGNPTFLVVTNCPECNGG